MIMNAHESARRRFLEEAAAAVPALLIMPLVYRPGAARAGAASKEAYHYQDHPNEGKHCANCTQFVPPEMGQALGSCQIVAGAISPDGWCMAFTSR